MEDHALPVMIVPGATRVDQVSEVELKLELAPGDLPRLRESPLLQGEEQTSDRLVSHYYDTSDRRLHAAGYMLRVRRSGSGTVQTVKQVGGAAGGLFVRPEWETPIKSERPVIARGDGLLGDLVDPAELKRVFTTDVLRETRDLAVGGARIEVALDEGTVRARKARGPLCELELELKGGPPEPLFALARELNALVPLRLGVRSKSERGFALADGEAGGAVKAEPILLDHTMDACTGFAAIANACIRHFRLNEPLVLERGDDETLHQARVALRRLRSAFSSFKPLLAGDARADLFKQETRWLAGMLGHVRDLDVLVPKIEGDDRERLVEARAVAMGEARIALDSLRARQLMIDLAEWIAVGAWRMRPAEPMLANGSIVELAADLLDRHRRRLKKRGQGLAELGDHDRHLARIEAKKLRYATEFFACLWPSRRARARHEAFLGALEKLQDHLGVLNDVAVAAALLERHGIAAPKGGQGVGKRLRKAEKAFDKLMMVKPFWD